MMHSFILLIPLLVLSGSIFCSPIENQHNARYTQYMKQLIKLSNQNPQYPFAAMIINEKTGEVLCTGVNRSYKNPTYHGEMVAINNCVAKYPKINWSDTTLITDAEPCSMCSSAIVWTKIPRLVYGSDVPSLLALGWDQINIRAEYVFSRYSKFNVVTIGGVLHEATDKIFKNALLLR